MSSLNLLARPARLERATCGFEVGRMEDIPIMARQNNLEKRLPRPNVPIVFEKTEVKGLEVDN